MWRAAWICILLSGCLGSSAPEDAPISAAQPAPDPAAGNETAPDVPAATPMPTLWPSEVALADCTLDQGFILVPGPDAAAVLPDPFVPAPYFDGYNGNQLPAELGGVAAHLDVAWMGCARDDAGLVDSSQFLAAVVVAPPAAELQEAHLTIYAYLLAVVTASANVTALYDAWNITTLAGDITFDPSTATLPHESTVTADGATLTLTSIPAPVQGVPRPGEAIRFFYHVDGALQALDVVVADHTSYLGPATLRSSGSAGWMQALPITDGVGATAVVSDAGWSITWSHRVF